MFSHPANSCLTHQKGMNNGVYMRIIPVNYFEYLIDFLLLYKLDFFMGHLSPKTVLKSLILKID